jgi:hypothetical protein
MKIGARDLQISSSERLVTIAFSNSLVGQQNLIVPEQVFKRAGDRGGRDSGEVELLYRFRQVCRADASALAHYNRTLNHILKLTDVTRPMVFGEEAFCTGINLVDWLLKRRRLFLKEMIGKHGDIVASFF